jgi:KaiC/GvpD/RAD55 family RecA-like ATPase
VLAQLPRAKLHGKGWRAHCPAHDDHEPSLDLAEGNDGRALLKCHAGCEVENIVSVLGLTMADLFERRNEHVASPAITLAALARAKLLPAAWLAKALGWYDLPQGGIGIPYRDQSGATVHTKRRTALKAKDGSYWPKGVPLMAYGLEDLAKVREAGYLIFVEGETDRAVLKYHDLPVLGLPGATSTNVLPSEHLAGFDTVYVWQESDKGGQTFVARVAARLQALGFQGVAKVVAIQGVKDPCELLAQVEGDSQLFSARMIEALGEAQALALPDQHATREGNPGLTLTRLSDLLAEPEEAIEWLVDDMLPAGGFSLLAAKPKVGKSTLARCLALAVARGEPFLGRGSVNGPVIYLALEEKRSEVRKHFQVMGATGEEEIYLYAATAPNDALAKIRAAVDAKKPALLIIDPLFRLTRVRDSNDYAEVTAALEPWLAMARETGVHVLVVHHLGKGERSGADAILGSTAIRAAVDTSLILKRTDRYRTIVSEQRYGEDLEETTLRFDSQTRMITLGEVKEREELSRMKTAIVEWLGRQDEPCSERDIEEGVEGNNRPKRTALRELVAESHVEKTGKGTRGDSYQYSLSRSRIYEKRESENPKVYVSADDISRYSRFETLQNTATSEGFRSENTEPGIKGFRVIISCVGCHSPFSPDDPGATKTMCPECAADVREGAGQ